MASYRPGLVTPAAPNPVRQTPSTTQPKLPEECVDYLSFNFNTFDLHKCWRNATKHKDHIVNGRRLENASWRKFFQVRFELERIDPAKLNWQKDSDVVWLFGPFVGLEQYEPLHVIQAAAAEEGQQDFGHSTLKPALKKRPEPTDFLQQIRELYLQTRNQDLLETSDPVSVTNAFRVDTYLPPPTGRRADFFLSNKPTAPKSTNIAGAETLLAGNVTPPRKKAGFIDEYNIPDATESSHNRHIRFNKNVEQALIIDTFEASTPSNTSSQAGKVRPPTPVRPVSGFFMDDEEEEDVGDFDLAGANKVANFTPTYSRGNGSDTNINSSSFPNSIMSAVFPPSMQSSLPSQFSIYSQPFLNSSTPSVSSATSASLHSHAHDEIDAVIGGVSGATDWSSAAGVGTGLLRRTQSEGNNFYVLARRLPETPPPPPSNYSQSPVSSTRSSLQRAVSNGSTRSVPGVTRVSGNAVQLPRVGSGLLPMVQLPPTILKSDDECSEDEDEDDEIFVHDRMTAKAAASHHKGSPPPVKSIKLETSDSEDEEEEEDGIVFGGSSRAPSEIAETRCMESSGSQIITENESLFKPQSPKPSSPATTITSSLVRTKSWIASTYPSSARSLGQLIYGPDIDTADTEARFGGNDDADSDLSFDADRMKTMWDESVAEIDGGNSIIHVDSLKTKEENIVKKVAEKRNAVNNFMRWATDVGRRWSWF